MNMHSSMIQLFVIFTIHGIHTITKGPMWFFFLKNVLIPNVAEKNILILVEEKKIIDSEFLSCNLMLKSGRNIRTLRDKKNNILTLVMSEKNILNETKNHNLPFKLNGRSLRYTESQKMVKSYSL